MYMDIKFVPQGFNTMLIRAGQRTPMASRRKRLTFKVKGQASFSHIEELRQKTFMKTRSVSKIEVDKQPPRKQAQLAAKEGNSISRGNMMA